MDSKPEKSLINLSNVHNEIQSDLDNIVSNLGITKAKFLRQVYKDLIRNTAEAKKKPLFADLEKGYIKIWNISNDDKQTLLIIADNEGQDLAPFLRAHLYKVIKGYPDKYKKPHPDF